MKKTNFNTRCGLPDGKIVFCHMVEPTLRITKTLSQNCLQELYLNVTDNSNKSFKSSDKECQRKVKDFIAEKDGYNGLKNQDKIFAQNAEESLEESNQAEIKVKINVSEQFINIIVIDNGRGFPPELIGKATESYVTTRSKGMGVGLAIVKRIVEEDCGVLDIANRETGGAVIDIRFNLEELKLKVKRQEIGVIS